MERTLEEVRVLIYGIGAIGSQIVRLILKKKGFKIVGAVDISPNIRGKDLGEVIGIDRKLGIIVSGDAEKTLSSVKADIAVHATSSFLKTVYPQITSIVEHGVNVISTCEELTYPYIVDSSLAASLDSLAKKHNVTVLGAGINPGFLMDALPIVLSGACQEIKSIRVERVIDAAKRRLPFQKKIGAGLSLQEFNKRIRDGRITGHVGLEQSVSMIADALKLDLEEVKVEPVRPVIAEKPVESREIKVEEGMVAGLMQTAYGLIDQEPFITLVFKAYIGAEGEYDSITIEGTPRIDQRITPCVQGDLATAAVIVNSIPKVIKAPPGLKTMKDLPIPSAVLSDVRKYL
ncbi:hypothetical protein CW706_01155 [Candidatus Bathyarchaeota archaeon]|nr:MAG: hypothetical protein CW706_01155 [Candidatus Bathyarchaeota archaeon]